MQALNLDYRHCDRKRPLFVSHPQVEQLAALARQQLGLSGEDALTLTQLGAIPALRVNGVAFDLCIGTDHLVHDEAGRPVFGICEFDPGEPNSTMISVSPASENTSDELVLSTLAHEIGHAIFDAPGWIVDAARGPGLFDDPDDMPRKAYRTTTQDAEHLSKSVTAMEQKAKSQSDEYFAELRANEFMGSLLVPRQRLIQALEVLAPEHGVSIKRDASLDPDIEGSGMRLVAAHQLFGSLHIDQLQRTLATRFGVHRRFIEVRMKRYGLLTPGSLPG